MFEKFAENVLTRAQEKLAAISKIAETDPRTYLSLLAKRYKRTKGFKNQVENVINKGFDSTANDLAGLFKYNLGADANSRLNQLTRGLSGKVRSGEMGSNTAGWHMRRDRKDIRQPTNHSGSPDGYLDLAYDTRWGSADKRLPYLKKLLPDFTDDELTDFALHPSRYLNEYIS